ncbi:hypothetical protein [Burkholderia phage FLC9]|nr:hypothetical protein [Burkholderia phage FLC9]
MSQQTEVEVVGRQDADEAVLDYTQGMRKQIVGELTKELNNLKDPKIVSTISQVLDGMDRQALGKMKIRVEEQQTQNQEGMAANIAELLRQMGSGGSNFQASVPVPRDVPALGSDVPDPDLVEGEVATNPAQQDFDSFHAQFAPVEGETS